MLAATHIALAAAGTLLLPLQQPLSALSWGVVLLGALLPDIDHSRSLFRFPGHRVRRIFPKPIVLLLNIFGWLFSLLPRAVLKHRGVSHSLFIPGVILWWGSSKDAPYIWWCGWGYLLHLIGDLCTKGGIPLFAPIFSRRLSVLPLRTGGSWERLFAFALWGYIAWSLSQSL